MYTWTGERLTVLGTFTANVQYRQRQAKAIFHVTNAGSKALLSLTIARELGMINELATLNECSTLPQEIVEILDKAFKGDAKVKMEPCHIELEDNATPVKIPARRVPIAYQEDLKNELDLMERNDVVQKISSAVEWCSPVVIAHKKNGKIRLCVDYRRLNEVIREPSRQIPTVEEVLGRVGDAKWFTTLDMRNGYWQLEVREQDRKLLAFGTPFGTYVWKRLPLGLKSSPMLFQDRVVQIVGNLPQVTVYLDDIMIATKTKEEHVKVLKIVLQRLVTAGVALSEDILMKIYGPVQRVRF